VNAVRAGLERGWIETKRNLVAADVVGWIWPSAIAVIVLFFLRDRTVPGTGFSLSAAAVPGLLGLNLLLTAMLGLAMALTTDRGDGTLLRMRAVPDGIVGYLVGKIVGQIGMTVAILVVVLVPGALLFGGLQLGSPATWALLLLVLLLGLVATLPLGAVLGAVIGSVQWISVGTLALMSLAGISGIFYPVGVLPEWLQWLAQVFPLYWMGLAMRSVLLPDALAASEIGGSWRTLETVAVLGAWAALGLLLAPVVLRRMARRESGSRVAR
jgi:ABC-2 type transport system permease protein